MASSAAGTHRQRAANCRAPKTDDIYVTDSACGRSDSGTSLVSGTITPNSGDPLLLEVSIPKVLNPVSGRRVRQLAVCRKAWEPGR